MLFQTTAAHEELRAKIRNFAEEEIKPLAFLMDQNNEFPEEAVKKLGKLGWMGIPYPKEYGGAGLDALSYAIAVEELARVDGGAGVILSAHVSLGSWPIFTYGTEEQKKKYLVPLAKGEKIGAFGLTEPNAGSDAGGTETTALDIQKSLAVWKPELECYTGLVQQIKEKSKERKALITEKKELPIYHVKRHKALAVRITELTEELEELRSEKALLLQKFEYAEDAGAEAFHKDIAAMEAGLKKLETQEQKYSAELDKALDEYAELKAQAADFDPVELYEARQAIRPAQEKAAEQQLEDALQKKPSFSLLLNAKQETSRLLKEDTEERQVRQMLIRRQRSDPQKPKHFQR